MLAMKLILRGSSDVDMPISPLSTRTVRCGFACQIDQIAAFLRTVPEEDIPAELGQEEDTEEIAIDDYSKKKKPAQGTGLVIDAVAT